MSTLQPSVEEKVESFHVCCSFVSKQGTLFYISRHGNYFQIERMSSDPPLFLNNLYQYLILLVVHFNIFCVFRIFSIEYRTKVFLPSFNLIFFPIQAVAVFIFNLCFSSKVFKQFCFVMKCGVLRSDFCYFCLFFYAIFLVVSQSCFDDFVSFNIMLLDFRLFILGFDGVQLLFQTFPLFYKFPCIIRQSFFTFILFL